MRLGEVIYRREADGAMMLYAGERDGWEMARVVVDGEEFEPHTLFALLARGGWEPTSAVPLEDDEEVVKHLAGTAFDHDQSSHGGGRGKGATGSAYATPNDKNTVNDIGIFNYVEAVLQRDQPLAERIGLRMVDDMPTSGYLGGYKHRNALDIADRLAESDVDPDDLLALVMQRDALRSAGPGVSSDLAESAAILGEYPLPMLSTEERLEVMGRNWENLAEVVAGDGLPDDVGVIGVQLSEGRWSVRLSRNPEQDVLDGRGEVVLRNEGKWSEDAVRVMGYVAVDTIQRGWAQTATGNQSDAIAAAALDELGMTVSVSQSPDWSGIVSGGSPYFAAEGRVHNARRAIIRAMYENTQDQLTTLFPGRESFVLYRGAAHGDLVNEEAEALIPGTKMPVTDPLRIPSEMAMYMREYKPLSSWTVQPDTAQSFVMDETEFVAAAIVPRERILSTAFTGLGAFNEGEFVVLGGKLPVAMRQTEMGVSVTVNPAYINARLANESLEADDFITINGQVIPLFKHLAGTEYDHDQQSHAGGGTSIPATGGRVNIKKVTDTTYRYDYGDFHITTNITGRQLLEDTRLEGTYYSTDNPPSAIEDLGEVAVDYQWNQWEGNFVMRHLAAAMMGLPHQYASGGEGLDEDVQNAIIYGERPDDEDAAEQAEGMLRDHAATTHAMLQAIADGRAEFAEPWDGIVRRGMVIDAGRDDSNPLLRLQEGDSIDLAPSGFTPSVDLLDRFLRGGDQSRDAMQSSDDFVFEPNWRSVMFELDTRTSRYIAPAGWGELTADSEMWVHTSYEDRAADADDGEDFRKQPAPWEVVTQGKFRVSSVRTEERTFYRPGWTDDPQTEDMRVITLQQTAVYNPRTNTYDALPGFITLPDGSVIPIEEAE